jgi:hypothetical protein
LTLFPRIIRGICACIGLAGASACGGGGGNDAGGAPAPLPAPALTTTPAECLGGMAGDFPCRGVRLHRRVPLGDLGGIAGNDIWGWTDSLTGAEYALMGMTNGTAFVNVSDPENPIVLGRLPTQTVASVWRDIKVYQDHAYIVADRAGHHGLQVFDLTRLRTAIPPQLFTPDLVYGDFGSAHNLAINEATGFAYVVGSDTCGHGLHLVDITTPNNPQFAGCFAVARTHDTQCVVYAGPDLEHVGREICASANEDHVALVDVTVKPSPVTLSERGYPQLGFVHQGWFNVFDVSDLDDPQYLYAYEAATAATDHNLYVSGTRVFQANYASGLRVLEFGDLSHAELEEIAFFDTVPGSEAVGFSGAWSVYPYFSSGTLVVSDTVNGLFILSLGGGAN